MLLHAQMSDEDSLDQESAGAEKDKDLLFTTGMAYAV